MQSVFFRELLGSLLERRARPWRKPVARQVDALCAALLTEVGDISTMSIGRDIIASYRAMSGDEKQAFFEFLATALDIDAGEVGRLAQAYATEPSVVSLAALTHAAEPKRQELLRRLNRVPGATPELVAMRRDLFTAIQKNPTLGGIDLDFVHLLSSWFNPGFLVLRRISWSSPANILEKIIAYEAVHTINGWEDLRSRVEPEDRRCFAYFHPSMPEEPLIFVEVALCNGIAGSIQTVLSSDRAPVPPESADTAVFYSISNCQAGLRGISFGNSLIKQVVEKLKAEFPHLTTFVTLSPIPGLRKWCDKNGVDLETGEDIRRHAAHYLVNAKRLDGAPQDSVARFHLGNGAVAHDIHADADVSDNGRQLSGGTMVNYLYDPAAIEPRINAFFTQNRVAVSPTIQRLLKTPRNSLPERKVRVQ